MKPVIQKEKSKSGKSAGLVERTMADIRALIRERRLGPGDALPSENALATDLGISRTIAREALRGLATLHLVEVGNGRRARVAAADADALSLILDHTVYTGQLSVQQVLDVRRTLELRTASLAALRRSDDQAHALRDIVTAMFAALETDDTLIQDLDIRFHETIAGASGNALYSIIVESFRVITQQTWAISWRTRATHANRLENLRCHERIATAILEQDPAAAEVSMAEHFDSAVANLLRAGVT